MRLVTPLIAELDSSESRAYEVYKIHLEAGHALKPAAGMTRRDFPGLDEKFYEWLER